MIIHIHCEKNKTEHKTWGLIRAKGITRRQRYVTSKLLVYKSAFTCELIMYVYLSKLLFKYYSYIIEIISYCDESYHMKCDVKHL